MPLLRKPFPVGGRNGRHRHFVRLQIERFAQRLTPARLRLPRQSVHQRDGHVVHAEFVKEQHCVLDVRHTVRRMQLVKIAQVDRSHAQLDAAWLALAPPGEAGHAHRVRNGLERHLGPMGHRKLGANKPHKLAQLVGAHNARASTADAHRHDALAFEHVPKRRHLAHDGFQVLAFGRAVPRQIAPMRIARSLNAKRHVDEQRRILQRRFLSCGRRCHGAFLPLFTPPMQTARTISFHHPPNRQEIVHPAWVNLAQGAPAGSEPKRAPVEDSLVVHVRNSKKRSVGLCDLAPRKTRHGTGQLCASQYRHEPAFTKEKRRLAVVGARLGTAPHPSPLRKWPRTAYVTRRFTGLPAAARPSPASAESGLA